MKTTKTILAIFLLALATFSCSGDDGSDGINGVDGKDGVNGIDGTNGVDGPQGPQGPQGQPGPQGPQGPTGTANVIYSNWINAPAGTEETIDGTLGVSTSFDVPQLTSSILSRGTILVYLTFGSGSNTFLLPYTSTAGGSVSTVSAISSLNKIKIFRFKHSADGTTVALPASLSYRYILIPGGVAAQSKYAQKDYTKMSYEEVCSLLNITE